MIAYWVAIKSVHVFHLELPQPLEAHDPADPAWNFIASRGIGPVREMDDRWGRADLALGLKNGQTLFVEFGTCAPGKFALNLGMTSHDRMIVPYGCSYAFLFSPVPGKERLSLCPVDLMPEALRKKPE